MQISEEHAQEVTVHERRIEQTQQAMGATVAELQHELSPATLAGNAGNAMKHATVGRSGHLISSVASRVKANPIPAAVMGAGFAWLWMSGRKDGAGKPNRYYSRGGVTSADRNPIDRAGESLSSAAGSAGDQVAAGVGGVADQVSSRVGSAADQVSGTVGDVADSARAGIEEMGYQAQRVQTSFQRMLEENPLPIALVAAGVGALLATAVPTTATEQRMVEPLSEQLSEQAKNVGQKVGRVADRAQGAAREEAQRQNLN